jgi:hypothetical protein
MYATQKRFAIVGDSLVSTNRSAQSGPGLTNRKKEVASSLPLLFSGGAGLKSNFNMTMSGPLAFTYLLTGIVPEHEEMLRRYYRDIYEYDHVAGAAVDIISQFPFSRWTLTGLDRKELEKFDESLFRLNLRSLLPEISVAYLVDAEYIGTLVFNHKDKVFVDTLNHNPDDCRVDRYPFYSVAPKIRVLNSKETRDFMNSSDPYARQIKGMFSQEFIKALKANAYELNPLTTLYLARRTLPSKPPISYLKRILPIYLLEKQLYRGTLVEAHKRQRSMLHVTAGDDNWEPTPEELDALVSMFQQMEVDPLGGVISTRTSVQATELRQGGDFWKWTDQADILVPYKLRALGISEAFLSADATYSNSETALSVFLENMDQYREFLSYGIFENRLFPIVSYTNEFFKDASKEEGKRTKLHMMYSINNQQNLKIPKLHWHKRLEAKNEDNQLDVLNTVSERGLPIPLRMWAAAAKIDMDTLIYELEEDKKYRQALAKVAPEATQGTGGGEEENEEYAAVRDILERGLKHRRKPLLSRDYGAASELYGYTKTGKKRHVFNQAEASKKVNSYIAKAARELNDPHVRETVRRRIIERCGRIPKLI